MLVSDDGNPSSTSANVTFFEASAFVAKGTIRTGDLPTGTAFVDASLFEGDAGPTKDFFLAVLNQESSSREIRMHVIRANGLASLHVIDDLATIDQLTLVAAQERFTAGSAMPDHLIVLSKTAGSFPMAVASDASGNVFHQHMVYGATETFDTPTSVAAGHLFTELAASNDGTGLYVIDETMGGALDLKSLFPTWW
jgi:hypothetical protein